MQRQLEESRGGQIRKKYPETRAKKQSWKKTRSHFKLRLKKPHQQQVQDKSIEEAKLSAAEGWEGEESRTETGDTAGIPPSPTQSPPRSL